LAAASWVLSIINELRYVGRGTGLALFSYATLSASSCVHPKDLGGLSFGTFREVLVQKHD